MGEMLPFALSLHNLSTTGGSLKDDTVPFAYRINSAVLGLNMQILGQRSFHACQKIIDLCVVNKRIEKREPKTNFHKFRRLDAFPSIQKIQSQTHRLRKNPVF